MTITDERSLVPSLNRQHWNRYLDSRRGTYEFRCKRYSAVVEKLEIMGLSNGDSICDIGAGRQELHRYLAECGYVVDYHPVDGSIDGTDIDLWMPDRNYDFMVAIELLEHLHRPQQVITLMEDRSMMGCVATTPNPMTVDVLAIDPTHVTPLFPGDFSCWAVEVREFFCKTDDSLLAWCMV